MQDDESIIPQLISRLGIDSLNPMQEATLESSKKDQDIILLSDTGTGKTLAYLLPLVQRTAPHSGKTQSLVVAPSRELALQIEQVFRKMATGISITCCYGGHKRETEENNLLNHPDIIVGTPGRIGDHLNRKNIDPSEICTLILDEFDKSLELGFQEQIEFILSHLDRSAKKILTSATSTLDIPAFLHLSDPVTLDFTSGNASEALEMQLVRCPDRDKFETLFSFICFTSARSSIIFCNHRESVERVSELLSEKGIVNVFYHGAMQQYEREIALCKFRNGTSTLLVTTDLAARGLDIPFIRYIIHYHLPATPEIFTHRNGRTARMDASGTAVILLGPDETLNFDIPDIKEITIPANTELPDKPKWSTLSISAGKKDKINKVDIVGFLTNKGQLKKEDVGLIEVKDFAAFAGIRKSVMGLLLQNIKNERIKNKKVKMDIAK